MSFFNVSNRPTFSALFGEGFFSDAGQAALRHEIVHALVATVRVAD